MLFMSEFVNRRQLCYVILAVLRKFKIQNK